MVRQCVPVANNNASLIWSVVKTNNCYRRAYKDPKLVVSSDPASQKCINRRSQVGFIQKKQLSVFCKKDKMILVKQYETKTGKIVKKGESATGPRRANRLSYNAGKNFLFSRNMAKAARIKACHSYCADNKVKKRGAKSTAA